MVPEVQSVLLPADPSNLPRVIDSLFAFEKLQLTQEDRAKRAGNTSRMQLDSSVKLRRDPWKTTCCHSTPNFELQVVGEAQLPRVHQLVTKTNQFNLTTRRYTMAEIEAMVQSPDWLVVFGHVEDVHGGAGDRRGGFCADIR